MRADKIDKRDSLKEWEKKWEKKNFVKYAAEGFTFFFPPLVGRSKSFTYNPEGGCLHCGNPTFRYYSKVARKKYYQCEKCNGINH